MSDASIGAKIVRIDIKRGETGLFFGTSPDLPGLLLAEHSSDAVKGAAPGAIMKMYAACGERVVVTNVSEPSEFGNAYVAIPAAVVTEGARTLAA